MINYFRTVYTYISEDQGQAQSYLLYHKYSETIHITWPQLIQQLKLQFVVLIVRLFIILTTSTTESDLSRDNALQNCVLSISVIVYCIFLDQYIIKQVRQGVQFFIVVISIIFVQVIIIYIISGYLHNYTTFQNFQTLHIMTNLMQLTLSLLIQPIFILKIVPIIALGILMMIRYPPDKENFTYYMVFFQSLLIMIIHSESRLRRITKSSQVPQRIINSLQIPVLLINIESLSVLDYNQEFESLLIKSPIEFDQTDLTRISNNNLKYFLQLFQESTHSSNTIKINNLYELLFEIYNRGRLWQDKMKVVQKQFMLRTGTGVQIFDVIFKFAQSDDQQIAIISMNNISAILEKNRNIERIHFKSKLIKSLSHELRTRKNIVQGLLTMFLQSRSDDLIQQAYNNSVIESNIISSIINYHLSLENQLAIQYAFYSIKDLINITIKQFQFELKLKNITYLIEINCEHNIYTDQNLFIQIMTNIVNNSIKFSNAQIPSTIKIIITKENKIIQDKEALHRQICIDLDDTPPFQLAQSIIQIQVIDNGIGIENTKLENIRRILFNDNEYIHSEKADGFQLGLRSCSQLLRKLNCDDEVNISLNSIIGQGTEIVLKFKILNEHTYYAEHRQSIFNETKIAELKQTATFKSTIKTLQDPKCDCEQSILICDDEIYNLIILEGILKQLNYKFNRATNGHQAVQKYIAQHQSCPDKKCKLYKAILIDYQMPILDGCNANRSLKQQSLHIICQLNVIIGGNSNNVPNAKKLIQHKPMISKYFIHQRHVEECRGRNDPQTIRCPLCHTDLKANANTWKMHLVNQGCLNNESNSQYYNKELQDELFIQIMSIIYRIRSMNQILMRGNISLEQRKQQLMTSLYQPDTSQMEQDIIQLTEDLHKSKFENNRLCELVLKHEDEIETIKNHYYQLQEQRQLEKQHVEMQMRESELKKRELLDQYEQALKHIEHLESTVIHHENLLKDFEHIQMAKDNEIDSLQTQINELRLHEDHSHDSLEHSTSQFTDKERKYLKKQIQEKIKHLTDQSCQLNQMSDVQKKQHANILSLTDQNRKLSEQMKNLQIENERLKKLLAETENQKTQDPEPVVDHLASLMSPVNQRYSNFSTHKDFDTPLNRVCSSKFLAKPQSSNSLQSNYTTQSKKKIMGQFNRLTSLAVGQMSTMLDYQSLSNGSKMASALQNAKIDLTQLVAQKKGPTVDDFKDNN